MDARAFFFLLVICTAALDHIDGRLLADLRESHLVHAASQVSVEVYYESLCPFSAKFIEMSLVPLMESPLRPFVSLTMFPYGNAKTDGKHFKCQHGEAECALNTIQGCILHYSKKSLAAIACIEKDLPQDWAQCVDTGERSAIETCTKDGEGTHLMQGAAKATEALKPPHTYVPYVVINGKHSEENEQNLERAVCSSLGNDAPAYCSKAQSVAVFGRTFLSV
ncbi:unnamed protein product [Vitrella brassicaformis CCMP3155]|uniref:Gamma-interferon-inducible lysosomal thiol reductase n=1 Tax=Vitrella brassicaformis (strain CCMP3155) TaxID=1169540 RepID=A0A0G4G8B1_VITBC|nr:unnamed protein product [Vitrella brassicaformis CCMP3155]|eukprot:CEM24584.1 unnamed protein product [Vitrella brassicaformis CCMP3155]